MFKKETNRVCIKNKLLYGFLLNDNVLFSIETRRLVYYSEEFTEDFVSFRTLSLNETQARLFICLLENRKNAVINKEDIMKSVWDEFNLSSSNQRLWQTVKELRKKLAFIGLPDDFIISIHGEGYSIIDSKVGELHIII